MTKSIAIAGKGGTGKTTIAALIVQHLCRRALGPVLAVDADPDSNLGTFLGIESAQTVGDLREEVLKEIKNFPAGMPKASYVEAGLHELIEEAQGFDLITMGRGEGSGCYCSLNNMIRKFSADLTPSYSWVVMDNEAGLEHLSRRTSVDIDSLIVVVNDNPISLNSAKRIQEITGDLNSRRGRIMGIDSKGSAQTINAKVPLTEIMRYSAELRSTTGGEGYYGIQFSHYDVVPSQIAEELIKKKALEKEEEEE